MKPQVCPSEIALSRSAANAYRVRQMMLTPSTKGRGRFGRACSRAACAMRASLAHRANADAGLPCLGGADSGGKRCEGAIRDQLTAGLSTIRIDWINDAPADSPMNQELLTPRATPCRMDTAIHFPYPATPADSPMRRPRFDTGAWIQYNQGITSGDLLGGNSREGQQLGKMDD